MRLAAPHRADPNGMDEETADRIAWKVYALRSEYATMRYGIRWADFLLLSDEEQDSYLFDPLIERELVEILEPMAAQDVGDARLLLQHLTSRAQ